MELYASLPAGGRRCYSISSYFYHLLMKIRHLEPEPGEEPVLTGNLLCFQGSDDEDESKDGEDKNGGDKNGREKNGGDRHGDKAEQKGGDEGTKDEEEEDKEDEKE